MKKIFCILSLCLMFAASCEQTANTEIPENNDSSLVVVSQTIADHNAVIIKPSNSKITAPVVVVVADDITLATRMTVLETPEVNFKAAEHCLIGNYILCVIKAEANDAITFLSEIKNLYPRASRLYLLSYCNGLAYTAAMVMPDVFNAYACVSGAIEVEAYKTNSFGKPVYLKTPTEEYTPVSPSDT